MQKKVKKPGTAKAVLLTILAVLAVLFVILPLSLALFDGKQLGNVARIAINGPITADGSSLLGRSTASSATIVGFIEEADKNLRVKVILLEINSPGGSAVASDEIAAAVKQAEKPVIALIREVGASGGYWIASAADHVIANRMSITGSIGVLSSYLEFSGLMDEYGVQYERLVAGEYKDVGSPFRSLKDEERQLLQHKLNRIHDFFIEEVAANRKLSEAAVRQIATGEFFLGAEALELGLVDELGDKNTAEEYIQRVYGLEKINYVAYQEKASLLELFAGVFSPLFFNIGEGFASIIIQQDKPLLWL